MKAMTSKIKALLLCVILLSGMNPNFSYAQVTQDPNSLTLNQFETNTAQTIQSLIDGFFAGGVVTTVIGGIPLIVNLIVANTAPRMGDLAYSNQDEFNKCCICFFGSTPAYYVYLGITTLGLMTMFTTGISWLIVQNQVNTLNTLGPSLFFDCQILSPVAVAPLAISCTSQASFARVNGATISSTEWDFEDGLGFQNLGTSVTSYPLATPRNYTIKVRVTDSNNHIAMGSFFLNVPAKELACLKTL